MPDFKKAPPKQNPFLCNTEWHLWTQPLALAIYNLAGRVTNSGEKPFFAKRQTVALHFGSHRNTTSKAFKTLINNGWFEHTDKEDHFKYVLHSAWAFTHPDHCVIRELQHWSEEADPFIGKLWAVAGGRFRAKPHWILGVRKYARSDEEVLTLFKEELARAAERRAKGSYEETSPAQCFYRVSRHLKQRKVATK